MPPRTLRSSLIRLAHEQPELRPHVLPLLREAAAPLPGWPPRSPREREEMWREWVGRDNLAAFKKASAEVAAKILEALNARGLKYRGRPDHKEGSLYGTSFHHSYSVNGQPVLEAGVHGDPGKPFPPGYTLTYEEVYVDSNRADLKDVEGEVERKLIPGVVKYWTAAGLLSTEESPEDVRKFVRGLDTWFEEDRSSDPTYITYSSRSHRGRNGDPYKAGDKDRAEAYRLEKAVMGRFGDAVETSVAVDQEWVFFSVRYRGRGKSAASPVVDSAGVALNLLLETAERNFAMVSGELQGQRAVVEFRAPAPDPSRPADAARGSRYERLFTREVAHLGLGVRVLPPRPGQMFWTAETIPA